MRHSWPLIDLLFALISAQIVATGPARPWAKQLSALSPPQIHLIGSNDIYCLYQLGFTSDLNPSYIASVSMATSIWHFTAAFDKTILSKATHLGQHSNQTLAGCIDHHIIPFSEFDMNSWDKCDAWCSPSSGQILKSANSIWEGTPQLSLSSRILGF